MNARDLDVVGLVPAAGRGKRIAPLPCSKELYPIGFHQYEEDGTLRPKVASHELFEKFRNAGIITAYVILRNGKWDIPAYFGDGQMVGMSLAYLVITDSLGPPDTLDRAYPFVAKRVVALGFPDILFGPNDVFERLLARLYETNSDIVLALYLARDVRLSDMVAFDGEGRIHSMVLKPPASDLRYDWVCAVWTPAFTDFMHAFLKRERAKDDPERLAYRHIDAQGDLPVGLVIKAAMENGLRVYGLTFPHNTYLDIGTPDNLVEAVRESVSRASASRPP
jgi:glucose-1-phosphate thymidylyltransferase